MESLGSDIPSSLNINTDESFQTQIQIESHITLWKLIINTHSPWSVSAPWERRWLRTLGALAMDHALRALVDARARRT